ncbi:protein FAM221A [Conger conger]|uniref:protein FAM221A n=1 Tax=Conger conger TaxID=82655 RepID=UPI002A59E37E|nr:protein FAM221A [Conger conger]XP_061109898.1 protein FAM221A [Conger conger]XP_061109899.1 protein FAM221A [Conger conger]
MERIIIDRDASVAIEEYLEYRRIVGDDDGGRLFVPEEYEEYKRKVLPARLRNRLYVSCGVPGGIDCKLIGPETPCFCSHRYKQHQTDFEQVPEERPLALPCRVRGCRCASYLYVLQSGPQAARCRCKHSAQDHSEAPGHLCGKCSTCTGFHSPYTCGCGQPSSAHQTLVETREEREGRGRPVGRDVPYAAMGGLTGFSSLADGYLRLDPSGTGAHMPALGSRFEEACSVQTSDGAGSSGAECVEDWRSREDRDMAFFERRYQERLKMEKAAKQKASSSKAKTRSERSHRK